VSRLTEVAHRAGVAPSVVSRLLNGDETLRIRAATRERVLAAVAELGYVANSSARSLRLARTGAIGLIVPDVTSPIYAEILNGAEGEAREAGYVLLLGSMDDLAVHEDQYRRLTAGGRVDGLLVQRGMVMADDTLRRFLDTSLPAVLMNSRLRGRIGSVTLDDALGITMAVDHLMALGHTRIAHLGGNPSMATAQARLAAFEDAVKKAGQVNPDLVVMTGYEADPGAEGMALLLSVKPRPTAICVASIRAALGAMSYLRSHGVRVPDDISVIALHDTWSAEYACPPLTTVKMPLRELGRESARLLIDLMRGGPSQDLVIKDPKPVLQVRESTASPHSS
jgi:LacI family transcriptional regulator